MGELGPVEVAHIVADGRAGGGSTMVLGLIDDLQATGRWRMSLVTQPGSYLESEARARDLDFIGFDFFESGFSLGLPRRLARAIGDRHFALTHLHGLRAAHHATQAPVWQQLGAVVYTVHGLHQLHLAPWLRALANVAERRVMKRVGEVVFVSRADEAAARSWRLFGTGARTRVIHNGADLRGIAAHFSRERDIDVLFLGRLVMQKGPEQAVRVLAALAQAGRRCVMAGGGPLRARCQTILAALPGGRLVQCLPEQTHEQALQLLARSRVLVMPSRWEGLPILPIEAMALGVPVVATQLSGTEEVLESGQTGWLTPLDDTAAMVDAAQKLLRDPALWLTMQRTGMEQVQRRFARSTGSSAYQAVYERLLSAGMP
jgi:glycosyltransferase involved in cell wall biosynthesis